MGDSQVSAACSCLRAYIMIIEGKVGCAPVLSTHHMQLLRRTCTPLPCATLCIVCDACAAHVIDHPCALTCLPLPVAECRELCGLPHVPLLPETLSRVLLPPSLQQHLDYLVQDREHGAAQLAAYVVEAFAAQLQPGALLAMSTAAADKASMAISAAACTAAADTSHQQDQEESTASDGPTAAVSEPAGKQAEQPRTDPSTRATPTSTSSNFSSRQSGQQVLEQLLDFGFLMATCRPSMAAIANAAAAVLLSIQRHLASSGSGDSRGAPSTEERKGGDPDLGALR
jgi:hypothetical protein